MRREKADPAYLWDMLDAAKTVADFVKGKDFHDYLTDRLLRSGVERQVEIIGEAARRVSDPFKNVHPEVPWIKIVRQRHVLAHDYDDIQNQLIWTVAAVHAVELISLLTPLIPPLPPDLPDKSKKGT